jgi:hypothetical protein
MTNSGKVKYYTSYYLDTILSSKYLLQEKKGDENYMQLWLHSVVNWNKVFCGDYACLNHYFNTNIYQQLSQPWIKSSL